MTKETRTKRPAKPAQDKAAPLCVAGMGPEDDARALDTILNLILGQYGCNFTGYKQAALVRRIQRRMGLHHIERLCDYSAFLQKNPAEVNALVKDIRIGVTEFFRDPEAWRKLEAEAITPLIESKAEGEPIRAWVAGCATGEEAYSLAMLLIEQLQQAGKHCPVQVFATDTNEEALQFARTGLYPESIQNQMRPKLIARFFQPKDESGRFRVCKDLRETVVFGMQNLFADPPFSRLDMITCRNLLIYLEPEIQQKTISLFDFALRPGGYLFLGSAETVGQGDDVFKPIVKKWQIYRHIATGRGEALELPISSKDACLNTPYHGGVRAVPRLMQTVQLAQQMLLDYFTPAAVLVNQKYETIYFCGPTEKFLVRPRGAPTQDLLTLARDGLRSPLRGALEEASVSGTGVVVNDARMKRDGVFLPVKLTVTPTAGARMPERFLLVVFEELSEPSQFPIAKGDESELVRRLEEELRATKADLQNAIQRLETSNEELKVSNEEVVSINQKLQSANEEMESSKEELQWLNEELSNVNQQLQSKVLELETANNCLNNLLASSEIATLCLDHELRIKSFTPALSKLLNVIATDVGRPFGDLSAAATSLGLLPDARSVLKTLSSMQKEFQTENNRWYIRRMLPYRAEDDHIDGVIVTFTDITESKRMAEAAIDARKTLTESLEQKVRERTAQLHALAVELTLAEERERRTLAQDLHDNLGQLLAVVKIKLASIGKNERRGNLRRALNDIGELIDQANNASRSLAFQMSPPVLYELGLKPAVEWLVEEMRKIYGLSVDVHDDDEPKPLDQATRSILFRAVRELLINVAKHADASVAEVVFRRQGERLAITVTDQGVGFDPETLSGQIGFGLLSVRERMGFIGGDIQIVSAPGEGTVITLTAPLDLENDAKEARP